MTTLTLFPTEAIHEEAIFPQTRYQGSKSKIIDWIWSHVSKLNFSTCLDAFGGTGTVAYKFKKEGKQVIYNDILVFNYLIGLALIENDSERLSQSDIEWILTDHGTNYPSFIQDTFPDIYFTDEENAWLDRTVTNINKFENTFKNAIAYFALIQACVIKRPYNLFHRKNLYVRTADVERSFGNKTTWDRTFSEYFLKFANQANQAIFNNGRRNSAICMDVFDAPDNVDLVYIDTPYISAAGTGVDYHGFYHFLEGLTQYSDWNKSIDYQSKHKRLVPKKNIWNDKNQIAEGFDRLFCKFHKSQIVVSYRSDGIPSETELVNLLKKYKKTVEVHHFGEYKYVLSKNSKSKEILLVAP